jgi:hypothetical protein
MRRNKVYKFGRKVERIVEKPSLTKKENPYVKLIEKPKITSVIKKRR